MREFAVIAMTLFSLTALGCSEKTEALANKSLMARPLEHPQAPPAASQKLGAAAVPAKPAGSAP
jgi:hypothetical protein